MACDDSPILAFEVEFISHNHSNIVLSKVLSSIRWVSSIQRALCKQTEQLRERPANEGAAKGLTANFAARREFNASTLAVTTTCNCSPQWLFHAPATMASRQPQYVELVLNLLFPVQWLIVCSRQVQLAQSDRHDADARWHSQGPRDRCYVCSADERLVLHR